MRRRPVSRAPSRSFRASSMRRSRRLISSRSNRGVLPVLLLALVLSGCHAAPQLQLTPNATRGGNADVASPAAAQLQRDIDAVLAAPALARGYWGVAVKSLGSNET